MFIFAFMKLKSYNYLFYIPLVFYVIDYTNYIFLLKLFSQQIYPCPKNGMSISLEEVINLRVHGVKGNIMQQGIRNKEFLRCMELSGITHSKG